LISGLRDIAAAHPAITIVIDIAYPVWNQYAERGAVRANDSRTLPGASFTAAFKLSSRRAEKIIVPQGFDARALLLYIATDKGFFEQRIWHVLKGGALLDRLMYSA
jgi:hypothetical protein